MDNDIENQMINNQIKKLSCVVCTIIGTFAFCGIVAYALCKSYKIKIFILLIYINNINIITNLLTPIFNKYFSRK